VKKRSRSSKGKGKDRLDIGKPIEHPRMPIMVLVRTFVIGSVGVIATGYAIYRHYTVALPSMLQPVPASTAAAPEPSSSEWVPAPEVIPVEPSAAPSPPAPPSPSPSR